MGLLPPRAARRWDGERVALIALALTALAFGLHSAIDWTWFVPGPTVMAVAAAGAVAGRSFLASRQPGESVVLGQVPRYVFAGVAGVVAFACAWAVWQPARSEAETDHALDLLAARKLPAAARAAEHAREIDPLSPNPLLAMASIAAARGDTNGALAVLQRAVRRFPGEPQVWVRLAEYQLDALRKPADALSTARGALKIDPESRAVQQIYLEAKRQVNPTPTTPAPAKPAPATPAPAAPGPKTPAPGPTPGRPVVPPAAPKTG
jgi:tetratricopeptide (TPR) repeat protein